jgi:hypothetical protein
MIDQQNQDLYGEVGAAFADVRFAGDRTADVLRRGRTLRRRRRAMPAVATAGVLAFSLSLAAVTQHSPASTPGGALVNVDEAAFSVHTNAQTGVVTVDIRELFNQSELAHVLAEAGVRVAFHDTTLTTGAPVIKSPGCWTGASVLNADKVLIRDADKADTAFEINRGAMPHGSVIGIDYITGRASNSGSDAVEGVTAQLLSGMPTGCV